MSDLEAAFDGPRNVAEIDAAIESRLGDLLAASRAAAARNADDPPWDAKVLEDITFADVKDLERPVALLSAVCRLLIKRGDPTSFSRCLRLAHLIHAFKCRRNESWYVYYLYKGVAQIGLNLLDPGITNILFAVSGKKGYTLVPVDRALGAWAIASAAVRSRNLAMAMTFAREWRRRADSPDLNQESFRADLAILLLHLVNGDAGAWEADLAAVTAAGPGNWASVVRYLEAWADGVRQNVCLTREPPAPVEPFPLWAGLQWHRPSAPEVDAPPGDFAFLCGIRRRFCNLAAIGTLSPDQMETCAHILAQWELPGPLNQFERVLRGKAPDRFHQFAMNRFLGRYRTGSILARQIPGSEILMKQEAVLLVMDVRNFSTLCQENPPEKIFELINPLFKVVNEELEQAGGTILEFEGDCIIVAFNVSEEGRTDPMEILRHAVACITRVRRQSALSLQAEKPEIRVGMGIALGDVGVGYIGGLSRCHMTVIGDAINLAARLESLTKESPSPILAGDACFPDRRPDVWADPMAVNFSLRDLRQRRIKGMNPARVYGLAPLIRYRVDFVPMGFVADPEAGVVYLDSGNRVDFGVIDHHTGEGSVHSTCQLLVERPNLLLGHLQGVPESLIGFRMHGDPDIDCAASFYAACELLTREHCRTELLKTLADYVSLVDQGMIPHPEHLADSLYGVFMVHQQRVLKARGKGDPLGKDRDLLEAGLRVIDAALFLLEDSGSRDLSEVFAYRPAWFAEERRRIAEDFARYREDLENPNSMAFTVRVNVAGSQDRKTVPALWLERPGSDFFKHWARTDRRAPEGKGYPFMVVDWSNDGKNRFVISIDPESGYHLEGLGKLLEQKETAKRATLGRPRPLEPRRWPADNADPWYFGQGHGYTIIDAPHRGTVLTAAEVLGVLEGW